MSGGGGTENGASLEYTLTWVVAVVCLVIVAISLAVERLLHYGGNYFKKRHQRFFSAALKKVKEEFMLLGFICLLLTVFQSLITQICEPEHVVSNMLPCARKTAAGHESNSTTEYFFNETVFGTARRLLAEETTGQQLGYCAKKVQDFFMTYHCCCGP